MRTHYSKYDTWIVAVLAIAFLGGLAAVVAAAVAAPYPSNLVGLPFVLIYVFVMWTMFGIRYDLEPPLLIVYAGFPLVRVPLDGIETISPTRNPLSSPAASLDRLRIDYISNGKKKWVMISPVDKQAFLADVAELSPGLVVDGDRAYRRAGSV